jgi:hypothetical protein
MSYFVLLDHRKIEDFSKVKIKHALQNLNKIFPTLEYNEEFVDHIIDYLYVGESYTVANAILIPMEKDSTINANVRKVDVSNIYNDLETGETYSGNDDKINFPFIIEDIELFLYLTIYLIAFCHEQEKNDNEIIAYIEKMITEFEEEKFKYFISGSL